VAGYNTIGYYNTAIGGQALNYNVAGSGATAVGYDAMFYANNSAVAFTNYNVAVGYEALRGSTTAANNTGNYNTALGYQTLWSNTSGGWNTAIGREALYSNTSGNENTANGQQALKANTTGTNNTASGTGALAYNNTGVQNTAIGAASLEFNTAGWGNAAIGYNAGFGALGVDFNQCTFVGAYSYPTVARTNVTMLGYGITNAECNGNNQVCIGNTAVTQVRAPAAVIGFTSYSDARFKTNIKENVAGLDFILKLKPVTYNVRPKELHKIWGTPDSLVNKLDFTEAEKETRIGFVAQDVEKAAKECAFNFPGIDVPRNDKEVYTLRYVDFIMPMVKGMQEQQSMIDSLKLENENLKAAVDKLQTTNNELKVDIEKIKQQLGMEAKK
jgi:hypothetical protein